jgi:hypothetical protein
MIDDYCKIRGNCKRKKNEKLQVSPDSDLLVVEGASLTAEVAKTASTVFTAKKKRESRNNGE